MNRAFGIVKAALNKRLSNWRKRRRIGLSWLVEKKLKHETSTEIKTFRMGRRRLYYISAQDLLHGLNEIFIDECYKIKLGSNPYIIDCGGNIGLSVLYFRSIYPQASIITFEPDRQNRLLLEKNVQSFGLSNVSIQPQAVWNENGTLQFAGEGGLASMISHLPDDHTYRVESIRLETFIDRRVDLLKLDIEGAEYEVVKDILPKLHLIDNIFIEYHSTFEERHKLVEMLDIVQKAGFLFYLREVFSIYPTPFCREGREGRYDIQVNIYCFRK